MILPLILVLCISLVWAHFAYLALEKILDVLQQQTAAWQRELLDRLSEGWRADSERHHQETLAAIRETMAHERVPINVQGFLEEFSRSLSTEVRTMLGEVGRIREEKRTLQHEIGELLLMKAKYEPGGEYEPDWRPAGPAPPPPPPPEPVDIPSPVRPAWRRVHPRREKKKKTANPQPAAWTSTPLASGSHSLPDPMEQLAQSWAAWSPEQNGQITPPAVTPIMVVPGRGSPGLFGPRSPSSCSSPPSPSEDIGTPPRPPPPPEQLPPGAWTSTQQPSPTSSPPQEHMHTAPPINGTSTHSPADVMRQSWVAWHPEQNGQVTPSIVRPIPIVPGRASPGLFGPRSPDSWGSYDQADR